MSGHSKWATTKHHKAAQDAKRSNLFLKLAKEITVAARAGNNPEFNSKLKLAIAKARAKSMPSKNIQNAILLANKNKDDASFIEIVYEGYINNGISVIVECLTNSNNRTSANMKTLFKHAGGEIGKTNSVSFLFDHNGILEINKIMSEEELMEKTIEFAKEIIETPNSFVLKCNFEDFQNLKNAIESLGISEFQTIETIWEPREFANLTKEQAIKGMSVIEKFQNDDDVQEIYHNIDLSLLD